MIARRASLPGVVSVLLLVISLFGSGCSSSGSAGGGKARPGRNPFGVMLGGDGLTAAQRCSLAQELSVPYFRPWSVTIDGWAGQDPEVESFQSAGFALVLSVRNKGKSGPPPTPSSSSADLNIYRQKLGTILDKYPAELLAVEDEEDSVLYWSGTPEQYGVELQAAREVAHARGIKCTNGGLTSSLVVALTWDHYRGQGRDSEAEDFLRRATTPEQLQMLLTEEGRARIDYSIRQGKRFLALYADAGIDYVNFHWFVPDTQALGEAVAFLLEATGLPPVCNEMGQRDTDPETVTTLLQASLDLGLPYVVWYSLDRDEAKALQNPDATWRENGLAFRQFMQEAFK